MRVSVHAIRLALRAVATLAFSFVCRIGRDRFSHRKQMSMPCGQGDALEGTRVMCCPKPPDLAEQYDADWGEEIGRLNGVFAIDCGVNQHVVGTRPKRQCAYVDQMSPSPEATAFAAMPSTSNSMFLANTKASTLMNVEDSPKRDMDLSIAAPLYCPVGVQDIPKKDLDDAQCCLATLRLTFDTSDGEKEVVLTEKPLGITFLGEGAKPTVKSVKPGSRADVAGVKPGWYLLRWARGDDSEDTEGLDQQQFDVRFRKSIAVLKDSTFPR